jgi:hypothetical protein
MESKVDGDGGEAGRNARWWKRVIFIVCSYAFGERAIVAVGSVGAAAL